MGKGLADLTLPLPQEQEGQPNQLLDTFLEIYVLVRALAPGPALNEALRRSGFDTEAAALTALMAGFAIGFEAGRNTEPLEAVAAWRLARERFGAAGALWQ
jgi:hypothetical protein